MIPGVWYRLLFAICARRVPPKEVSKSCMYGPISVTSNAENAISKHLEFELGFLSKSLKFFKPTDHITPMLHPQQ